MATPRTRVRHEGSLFSYEGSAHRIRDGRISGQDFFHLRGKVAMAMRTDPTFSPMYGGFAALRAAVGGSWTSPGMQQPDGKRVVVAAIRPPGAVLPAPVGVSLSLPAGLLMGARPVGLQEQGHLRGCCNWRREQHMRIGRHRSASAPCLSMDMLSGRYWSDVCHVSYCMYRQYLSSCVSWP